MVYFPSFALMITSDPSPSEAEITLMSERAVSLVAKYDKSVPFVPFLFSVWPFECVTEQLYYSIMASLLRWWREDLLCLQLVGEARVEQLLTAELTLVNPLPELLKDCSFTIEGVGLTDGKPLTHRCARLFALVPALLISDHDASRRVHVSCSIGDVGPRQEAKASIQFSPSRAGATVLLVNFHSDKLTNIKSFINVVIGEWVCAKSGFNTTLAQRCLIHFSFLFIYFSKYLIV